MARARVTRGAASTEDVAKPEETSNEEASSEETPTEGEAQEEAPAAPEEPTASPVDPNAPVESEEDADAAVDADPAPLLDMPGLMAEAKLRRQQMESRPDRGLEPRTMDDIDRTFASFVIQLFSQGEQAMADAIRAEAERRMEFLDKRTDSKTYKRHALASDVLAGKFNR